MENSFKHLKPESHYNDLYDRMTIEECRRLEKIGIKEDHAPVELEGKKEDPKLKKIKNDFKVTVIAPTALYFKKGERYANKSTTIANWMHRDREVDERIERAILPLNVYCQSCGAEMQPTGRDLQSDSYRNGEDNVLFFFECQNCRKRKLLWEDGREWSAKYTCEKCKGNSVKEGMSRTGNTITTVYACQSCGHKEQSVLDLDEKPEREKPDPKFEKDRQRFCLSRAEGEEYIDGAYRLKGATDAIAGMFKKEAIRKKISDIKRLTIGGLLEVLNPAMKKDGYIKFEFSQPEMSGDIIISFTVQDKIANRAEYDSVSNLKKIFKALLAKTNWRLMSDGIHYRLGILSGRLRGYEHDEDLLKLKENKITDFS